MHLSIWLKCSRPIRKRPQQWRRCRSPRKKERRRKCTWLLTVRINDSLVIGGYQAILKGTALCSMRSESANIIWSGFETSRSYSTWQHGMSWQSRHKTTHICCTVITYILTEHSSKSASALKQSQLYAKNHLEWWGEISRIYYLFIHIKSVF